MSWVRLAVVGIIVGAAVTGVARAAPSEAELKAAFVLRLATFVTWPEVDTTGSFRIAVVDAPEVHDALSTMAVGNPVRGRAVTVLDGLAASSQPEIVFLGDPTAAAASLLALRGFPSLTMSDVRGFALDGGMIEFVREGNKIRLDVNLRAAHESGLKISSKVLGLARNVYE